MPQRFLRPGITNSERWNAVSFEAQSLYVRILTLVDDFGRYDARTPILHGHCFALRPDIKQTKTLQLRNELHNHGLIQVYSADGREYLQVLQWQERARQDKSKFPEPSAECDTAAGFLDDPQDSAADGSGPQPNPASIDHRPSPLHPRPSTIDHRHSADADGAGFEDFWLAYPKKAGKGDAERSWRKQKLSSRLPEILTAVRKCKVSVDWTKEDGRFIPHPATWLNRRGWEDELTQAGMRNGIVEDINPLVISP